MSTIRTLTFSNYHVKLEGRAEWGSYYVRIKLTVNTCKVMTGIRYCDWTCLTVGDYGLILYIQAAVFIIVLPLQLNLQSF